MEKLFNKLRLAESFRFHLKSEQDACIEQLQRMEYLKKPSETRWNVNMRPNSNGYQFYVTYETIGHRTSGVEAHLVGEIVFDPQRQITIISGNVYPALGIILFSSGGLLPCAIFCLIDGILTPRNACLDVFATIFIVSLVIINWYFVFYTRHQTKRFFVAYMKSFEKKRKKRHE